MKVLLVDHHLADIHLVRDALRGADPLGSDVRHAGRLAEALSLLQRETVDAVVLDLDLPDAHGLEALASVVRAFPEIPIVVLSARDDARLAIEAVQNGAQDYLLKSPAIESVLPRALHYAIERKRFELQIQHLAHHDPLTNLPNRRLLMDRLSQAIERTRRERRMLALLFVDLDRFKEINDTLGHAGGDELLQAVAARLIASMRRSDTVARLSGDEFTLVLPEIQQVGDASRFATKVLNALQKPIRITVADRTEFVTASIGIALFPNDGDTADGLLRCADSAMYQAKQQGGDRYVFHSYGIEERSSERMLLARDLRQALEEDQFILHYQPRVDVHSRRVVGVEALVRWNHPSRGLLPAGRFVPIAEESGVIEPLDEWVLHRACEQGRVWNAGRSSPLGVSVNLSSREFWHTHLHDSVERALADTDLPPSCLELELTESGIVHDQQATAVVLRELSDMGVRIALDDFGVGYSSLSRLREFPIDALKIDRSFIRDVTSNPGNAAIILAIIAMGHGMGLRVVAEGVEAGEQAAFLGGHGCDEMQGFYFGRPEPAEAIGARLAPSPGREAAS